MTDDRLTNGAAALRQRNAPGDEHAARMLELCQPIAQFWHEPYAAPFVPLLEAALRLAKGVTPNGQLWEREDERYEVLIDTTIYDEATTLANANYQALRALDEIEAGELADSPVYIRRITQDIREARP